jgi:hypothetical protein
MVVFEVHHYYVFLSVLEIRTVFRADRGAGSFENKGGSRIADLAPSDIRRILQIRLPNADPYYIIRIESIFQGGIKFK